MIIVTQPSGTQFAVNPDHIVSVRTDPDTVLLMSEGSHLTVAESLDQIVESIARFRAHVITLSQRPEASRQLQNRKDRTSQIWDLDEICGDRQGCRA